MEVADAVDLGRQAVMMSLLISAPVLIAGLVVGMVAVLAFCLPWLFEAMLDYIRELYLNIPEML